GILIEPVFAATEMPVVAATADQWIAISGQFNDRLLNIVIWSLGTVAAVGALIVGGNWFVNNRSYARDRESLRETVSALTSEARASLSGELQAKVAALRSELMAEAKSHDEVLQEKVANVSLMIEADRQNISTSLSAVGKNVEDNVAKLRQEINKEIRNSRHYSDMKIAD